MSVYFAQVGPNIKIGFSNNPERRVRRLFASHTRYTVPEGTPLDLASRHLIRYIDGDMNTEWLIHEALSDFSLGNEFYVDEPEVREFIATVEERDSYPKITRPAGPAYDHTWDGCRTEAEREQLHRVLNSMFQRGAA